MTNVTRLKPIYNQTLAAKVENYRVLDREIKTMQKTADKLKATIIEEMGESESVFNTLGHEIATYKSKNYSSFNKISFEIEYPGVYDQFVSTKITREFRLKA